MRFFNCSSSSLLHFVERSYPFELIPSNQEFEYPAADHMTNIHMKANPVFAIIRGQVALPI
jgi:hypothetical protein